MRRSLPICASATRLQELDDTAYWIEILVDSRIVSPKRLDDLRKETNELLAISTASARTAKKNR